MAQLHASYFCVLCDGNGNLQFTLVKIECVRCAAEAQHDQRFCCLCQPNSMCIKVKSGKLMLCKHYMNGNDKVIKTHLNSAFLLCAPLHYTVSLLSLALFRLRRCTMYMWNCMRCCFTRQQHNQLHISHSAYF